MTTLPSSGSLALSNVLQREADFLTAGNPSDDHQALLKALQHPLRRELLKLLSERGEKSPVEAAEELDETLSNVSYHMTQLANGGAVNLRGTGQVRGAVVHFYVPNPEVTSTPWVREVLGLDRGKG